MNVDINGEAEHLMLEAFDTSQRVTDELAVLLQLLQTNQEIKPEYLKQVRTTIYRTRKALGEATSIYVPE